MWNTREVARIHPWLSAEGDVLVCTYPESMSEDEFERYYAMRLELDELKETPFALLLDCRGMRPPDAVMRRRMAELQEKTRLKNSLYASGVVFVVPNRIWVGLIKAVFWLAEPTFPYLVTGDFSAGLAWSRRQLDHWREGGRGYAPGR